MIKIQVLGKEKIQKIHDASIEVLSEIGVVLKHPEVVDLLLERGANIKNDRVLMPESLIEESLEEMSRSVRLIGREPEKAIELGKGACYSHNVGGVPNVYDPLENTRRSAVRKDVAESARLLDALPNVASVTPLYTPQDVPGDRLTLWMAYETLLNTTKPFRAPGVQTGREVNALAEMFQIACPDGSVTVGISPISPLSFPDDIVDAILTTTRRGMILGPLPCPILGATAPMSIAGGLAQQNAEVLACVVLGQAARPGSAVIYKGRLSVIDPRSGLSVWGSPEIGMISAATVEMGHSYGMPVDVYGLCTNAHTIDAQSGYERALNSLVPVLAGADEVSGVGEMDGGLNASLAQIVIDDEILESVLRIRRSFDVDEETLAVDTIKDVMDGSQNYLAEAHTVRTLRSGEIMNPKVALRDSWSQWEAQGKKNILEYGQEKALELLSSHEVARLDPYEIAGLESVIDGF